MHRHKFSVLVFLFLLCASFKTFSQISASPSVGCLPLPVTFSYTGSGTPSSESWTLNSNVTSTASAPQNVYTNSGTFTITYTAIVGGNPVTHSTTVTVMPLPTATLSAVSPTASHCFPMTATLSVNGAPTGANFSYNFGDGNPNTVTTATSITGSYTFKGSFVPNVVITTAGFNCSNTINYAGAVNVSSTASLTITATPNFTSCGQVFTNTFSPGGFVSFNPSGSASGSPLSSALNYTWTLVGGTPSLSTLSNPNNIVFAPGQYTVLLTATDDNNCTTAKTQTMLVSPPSISVADIPTLACVGSAIHATVNSYPDQTTWFMGYNNVQTTFIDTTSLGATTNSLHIYTDPVTGGVKTISIQVTSGGCTSVLTKTILVEKITAQFTFAPSTPTISCSSPMTASVINQSSVAPNSGLAYAWATTTNFAVYNNITPQSSIAFQPTFTLTQGSNNPYVVYNAFSPDIMLVVTSTLNGCSANITHAYHTLQRPTAWFNKNKREGCAPLAVTFRDSSNFFAKGTSTLFAVSHYTWNNGAGQTFSGTTSAPNYSVPPFTHSYGTTGTYTPFLTIQTFGGCTDVSFVDTVMVSSPPSISLSIANPTVCAGVPVTLSLQAAPGQTVQHWHINSDNGFYSGCVSNATPAFPFTHTGTHNFTVTGAQHGCSSSSVFITPNITVSGPFAQFRHETNCANTFSVNFYSYLQDVQTAVLNFGDATPPLNIGGTPNAALSHSTTHTYASAGDYTVTLTSLNTSNGCAQRTYTQIVRVRQPQAVITNSLGAALPALPNALACSKTQIMFSGLNSVGAAQLCYKSDYTWNFHSPNGTALPVVFGNPTVSTAFPVAGIYTVTLKVQDINGCQHTDTKQFRVSSAKPSFTFNANPICLNNNPVQMFNNTSQVAPDVITSYTWNVGDGSPEVSTQTVSHSYTATVSPPARLFTVRLVAQNSFGCKDTTINILQVNNPFAGFNVSPAVVCAPDDALFTLIAPPQQFGTYTVSYSDSSAVLITPTTTAVQFKHRYTTAGTHTVSIRLTDDGGCISATETNQVIAFNKPIASFTTIGDAKLCLNTSITFTSTSAVPSNSVFYTWKLNANTFPTNLQQFSPPPLTVPDNTITLIIEPDDAPMCADTAIKIIHLYDTKGTLVVNKNTFCLGDTIHASLTNTQDVDTWQCNVGFGIPSYTLTSDTQSVAHAYTGATQVGTQTIIAIVKSPNDGCHVSSQQVIEIIQLSPEFKRNSETLLADTVHCAKIPDVFTSVTNTISSNITYTWSFGDGATSSNANSAHTYTAGGVFPVQLTLSAPDVGCVVSAVKNMTIYALPTATILTGDNCANKVFELKGTSSQGVVSGTWAAPPTNTITSLTFTLTDTTFFATNLIASQASDFTLSVTDTNACVSDAVIKNINVIASPKRQAWDTTIYVGETATLNSDLGSDYSYKWTPLTHLSCGNCPAPVSSSTANIIYSVQITDYLNCFIDTNTFRVIVKPSYVVEVPGAFTPNGDGVNDIIYAVGMGIKKLNYFRVYNRWGQLLFETNDIKQGWDGKHNDVPQNMETYVYQVSVQYYLNDKTEEKTGTFKLLR